MANKKRFTFFTDGYPAVTCDACYEDQSEYYTGPAIERLAEYEATGLMPEEVAQVRHGRWMYDSGSGKYFCSACDEYALSFKKDTLYGGDLYEVCLTDYCPSCGAKMDSEQ